MQAIFIDLILPLHEFFLLTGTAAGTFFLTIIRES